MTAKTAIEANAILDERSVRIRHATMHFLNNTKALHLERDLTEFLIDIDRRHQEEIEKLNTLITALQEDLFP